MDLPNVGTPVLSNRMENPIREADNHTLASAALYLTPRATKRPGLIRSVPHANSFLKEMRAFLTFSTLAEAWIFELFSGDSGEER